MAQGAPRGLETLGEGSGRFWEEPGDELSRSTGRAVGSPTRAERNRRRQETGEGRGMRVSWRRCASQKGSPPASGTSLEFVSHSLLNECPVVKVHAGQHFWRCSEVIGSGWLLERWQSHSYPCSAKASPGHPWPQCLKCMRVGVPGGKAVRLRKGKPCVAEAKHAGSERQSCKRVG